LFQTTLRAYNDKLNLSNIFSGFLYHIIACRLHNHFYFCTWYLLKAAWFNFFCFCFEFVHELLQKKVQFTEIHICVVIQNFMWDRHFFKWNNRRSPQGLIQGRCIQMLTTIHYEWKLICLCSFFFHCYYFIIPVHLLDTLIHKGRVTSTATDVVQLGCGSENSLRNLYSRLCESIIIWSKPSSLWCATLGWCENLINCCFGRFEQKIHNQFI
jgi:hypothetical protein